MADFEDLEKPLPNRGRAASGRDLRNFKKGVRTLKDDIIKILRMMSSASDTMDDE